MEIIQGIQGFVDDVTAGNQHRHAAVNARQHAPPPPLSMFKHMHRSARPGLAAYLPPTKDEAEEISVAFLIFQKDPEGRIGYHEVKAAIKAMGFPVKKGELLQMLSQCCEDADELGVSKEEFSSVCMRFLSRRTPVEELQRDFAIFDTKSKGYIDIEDVRRVAKMVGGPKKADVDLVSMIAHFDSNNDGKMTIQDFGEALGRSHKL